MSGDIMNIPYRAVGVRVKNIVERRLGYMVS